MEINRLCPLNHRALDVNKGNKHLIKMHAPFFFINRSLRSPFTTSACDIHEINREFPKSNLQINMDLCIQIKLQFELLPQTGG